MAKAPEAFRRIGEVSEALGIPKHVLRFWEKKFRELRPMKRNGGRRYYRPEDIKLLRGIRQLLYDDCYKIKGVQKILREQGVRYVMEYNRRCDTMTDGDTLNEIQVNGYPCQDRAVLFLDRDQESGSPSA